MLGRGRIEWKLRRYLRKPERGVIKPR